MYVRIGKNTTQTDRKENFTYRQVKHKIKTDEQERIKCLQMDKIITQIQANETKDKNRQIGKKKVTTK